MNAPAPATASVPGSAVQLLRTLVICDLADSTAMVERLGDQRAAEVFRHHDRLVRGLIRQHGGQEIDKTDGFLSMFERPIQAVGFALEYQRALRAFGVEHGIALAARIGIHIGDVVVWSNLADDVADGAKPVEVEGLAKPVAARLMGLALPGQILLSGVAHSIALRAQGELGATLSRIRWCNHGRFRFKGVPDAVPVFEVGEEGVAPLKAPAWTGKAHRETPLWRRPTMIALEAVLLLALVAVPLWHLLRPQPAIAFVERDWVVVGDLRNLTGDSRFDNALHEAFRIGLEQSRHVNVLSDLQVRNTLELMQLDPVQTPIDRGIGAELARREGARALILPTIAEIGGRVRFTAEVVDPVSQITVHASSADGTGQLSVLPSVDQVNRDLRAELGEALERIDQDSQPLEKVATPHFDALRAYTLARKAQYENRLQEAIELLRQALVVDPGFARARMEIAILLRNLGDRSGALRELELAGDQVDRLSARDQLHVDALIAAIAGTPREALAKWRMLAELYPDHYPAQGALGFFAWQYANRHDEAIAALQRNAVSQNPRRGSGHYVLGSVLLAADRRAEALEQFELSEATGRRFENQFYAATHAAERRFDQAYAVLGRGADSGVAGQATTDRIVRAALAVDQGRWPEARQLLAEAAEIAGRASSRHQRMVATVKLSMAGLDAPPPLGPGAAIATFVDEELAQALPEGDPAALVDRQRRLLLAAWLAARANDGERAAAILEKVDRRLANADYPELAQRLALAEAELARVRGEPEQAVRTLTRLLDGSEFHSVRLALMDAYVAVGAAGDALEQALWLAEHRGRAYAEMHGDHALMLFNVAQSNLALLAAAEQALALERGDEARRHLEAFQAAWPADTLTAAVTARVDAVTTALPPTPVPAMGGPES